LLEGEGSRMTRELSSLQTLAAHGAKSISRAKRSPQIQPKAGCYSRIMYCNISQRRYAAHDCCLRASIPTAQPATMSPAQDFIRRPTSPHVFSSSSKAESCWTQNFI